MSTMGEMIRKGRKQLRLTQAELGLEIGIPNRRAAQTTIAMYENNNRFPVKHFVPLVDILGLSKRSCIDLLLQHIGR